MTVSDRGLAVLLMGLCGTNNVSSSTNVLTYLNVLDSRSVSNSHVHGGLCLTDVKTTRNGDISVPSISTGQTFVLSVYDTQYGVNSTVYHFMITDMYGNTEYWDGSSKWTAKYNGFYNFRCLG